MKIRSLLLVSALFLSGVAYANQLDGLMTDEGFNYSVRVVDRHGREYLGMAEDQGDGTLTISVEDVHGNSYSGYGRPGDEGGYDLLTHEDDTQTIATGYVEQD